MVIYLIMTLVYLLAIPGVAHGFVFVPPPGGQPSGNKRTRFAVTILIGLLFALGLILFIVYRGSSR